MRNNTFFPEEHQDGWPEKHRDRWPERLPEQLSALNSRDFFLILAERILPAGGVDCFPEKHRDGVASLAMTRVAGIPFTLRVLRGDDVPPPYPRDASLSKL